MQIDWSNLGKAAENPLQLIGRTPMVRLDRIPKAEDIQARIFVKLEFVNPTGSFKDRIYLEMITKAIERGELKPGMEIIEVSTGNAGIACTFVGRMLGYKVTVVMPSGMSPERMKTIKAFGGEVITTPGAESDVDLCMAKVTELKAKYAGKYWEPDQFGNPDNISAHYRMTGPEVWAQMEGKIDCLVAAVGSGGTLTGVGRYLKEKNGRVAIYAAEPSEAPILSKRRWGSHKIQGIGDGLVPRNLDMSILDGVVLISSEEAIKMTRRLHLEEGVFCGISSGCNVMAAVKLAKRHPEFKSILTIIPDTGSRYLSTEVMGEMVKVEIPEREHPLDQYSIEQLNRYQSRLEVVE